MTLNPFENNAIEEETTRRFLCCLHNLSYNDGFDGMMPRDIYNRLGYVTGEEAIAQRVQWIVNICAMKGYIEPTENTDKIILTDDGHKYCLLYCSGPPSY
jgi:hypothetical protein